MRRQCEVSSRVNRPGVSSGFRFEVKLFLIVTLISFTGSSFSAAGAAEVVEFDSSIIRNHVAILSADSLEGRKVGTVGEEKAARYIIEQFQQIGLKPAGDDNSFKQAFDFTSEIKFGPANALTVDSRELKLNEDYVPLKSSHIGDFSFENLVYVGYGIELDTMDHHDYEGKDVEGKAVLIERFAPDGNDPHSAYYEAATMDAKIAEATKRGVSGIFFFTPEDQDDSLSQRKRSHTAERDIPILYLKRSVFDANHATPKALAGVSFAGKVDLQRIKSTGHNVLGLLAGERSDGSRIVVVGAHYDHLGWGGSGSGSLYTGKEPQIHNGADDNASGTAGVIELARYFASKKSELDYSLLFMTFSGEESGLLGSNYFVKNPTIDLENVNFMINMDMIGRLKEEKGLPVQGVGTSPAFKEYFENYDEDFKIVTSESGVGPSDHTAFYNGGVPTLFFFTGAHKQYHRPTDDVDLVNASGEAKALTFIASCIERFAASKEKLEFTRTKDAAPGKSPRFTVTLGVMPDYTWEERGLHIDGVTEERAADVAGVLAGDIVIKIGEYEIVDIYAYMAALSRFRKGDTTQVVVDRDGIELTMTLVF
jgi:Peptidase family M28/PDZ domain